jgi:hypothetical protein
MKLPRIILVKIHNAALLSKLIMLHWHKVLQPLVLLQRPIMQVMQVVKQQDQRYIDLCID